VHASFDFLQTLALVLCVAAITTVLFQRLRQPVVFGYLLAGMIIGPHLPIPLSVDESTVHTLSELGVILLMFGLGLEFSLRKLVQLIPTAGIIALIQSSAMVWFGYLIGQVLGWTPMESVYAGAAIAISSTTIIVKAFAENRVQGRFTELVFGVLIIEDIIAIFLLAILTAVSAGQGVSATGLGVTAARLVAFLVGLTGVGLLLIPRFVRGVVAIGNPETTLVTSIGICFAAALLALAFGYSVALGAFIAGSLVAESGEEKTVEHLVAPVRDMFAAIFFVSVGMMIDPRLIAEHWVAVLVLTIVVIVGKVVAVSVSAFFAGYSTRTAVQTGMSLAQIGEFSFIIAGVGLSSGATRSFLYPVAVAVSAITTLVTPWLIRASAPTAKYVDRKLPKALQTFATLYGSWIERMRRAPADTAGPSRPRRTIRVLVIDTVLIVAIIIGTSLNMDRMITVMTTSMTIDADMARIAVAAAVCIVLLPLIVGLIRSARQMGTLLALRALPATQAGTVDFADAPRRAFVVTLQLATVCIAGFLILAVTQPFVPTVRGGAIFVVVLVALGVTFWRSATNLQGHARAGAEVIVAALVNQMASTESETTTDAETDHTESDRAAMAAMEQLRAALPGLGEPVRVRIPHDSPAVDQTLATLNLRGLTGATVFAITRHDERIVLPVGKEVLRAGDALALVGTHDAVDAAIALLRPPMTTSPTS